MRQNMMAAFRVNQNQKNLCKKSYRASRLRAIKLALSSIGLLFLCSEVSAINSVLDIKGTFPYLINKTNGELIEPRDYLDFDNIYNQNETYKRQQTAQGRAYHLLKAFDFANYFQSDYWHYSDENDLRQSAAPVADAGLCRQHLDWLETQLNRSSAELFGSGEQHIKLMTLVDSFGRPESSTYLGHAYWLGSHYECTRAQVDMDKFEGELECKGREDCSARKAVQANGLGQLKTRYCIGKARDIDWPSFEQDNYTPGVTLKVGLCLPETCETLSFANHRFQLERLMRFQLPEYLKSRITLNEIYCLPDSRSPIRALSLSARVFLGLCTLWLIALVASTWLFSCYKRHQRDLAKIMAAKQQANIVETSDKKQLEQSELGLGSPDSQQQQQQQLSELPPNGYAANDGSTRKAGNVLESSAQLLISKTQAAAASLALNSALDGGQGEAANCDRRSNSSYQSSSSSLPIRIGESALTVKLIQALSIKESMREFREPPVFLRKPKATKRLRINLNPLDAIKCLCCVLVILGHTIFIHINHLSNIEHTIELSNHLAPRLIMGIFVFVDTFFIISGMLTAYFVFKRFSKRALTKPIVWAAITLLRLLRLSPVYILVFWFIKTLAVHLSDGPIWDYGTDKDSIKGLCIGDHWWKSLLYLGNLGTMQPLCILPAWSIIVDAQYSIIIPPILCLLLNHKRLGYLGLVLAIIASTVNMSHQLATQTAVKTNDMARVRLHVYPLISRFAAEYYNTAWNRVGSVAIGIMGGQVLHMYDRGIIKRWPGFMRGTAFKFILFAHAFIFLLPFIGRLTDNPNSVGQETNLTIFVLSNSAIKPIWCLINTIFILRLITDLHLSSPLARLMSHNVWHCLGKLCFTSYLIHYEIILTLLKSRQEGLLDLNWSNIAREFSLTFLISTLIAYFVYIFFEAPINKLVSMAIPKPDYAERRLAGGQTGEVAEEGEGGKKSDGGSYKLAKFEGQQQKDYLGYSAVIDLANSNQTKQSV